MLIWVYKLSLFEFFVRQQETYAPIHSTIYWILCILQGEDTILKAKQLHGFKNYGFDFW